MTNQPYKIHGRNILKIYFVEVKPPTNFTKSVGFLFSALNFKPDWIEWRKIFLARRGYKIRL